MGASCYEETKKRDQFKVKIRDDHSQISESSFHNKTKTNKREKKKEHEQKRKIKADYRSSKKNNSNPNESLKEETITNKNHKNNQNSNNNAFNEDNINNNQNNFNTKFNNNNKNKNNLKSSDINNKEPYKNNISYISSNSDKTMIDNENSNERTDDKDFKNDKINNFVDIKNVNDINVFNNIKVINNTAINKSSGGNIPRDVPNNMIFNNNNDKPPAKPLVPTGPEFIKNDHDYPQKPKPETKYDAIYSCESLNQLFDKGWDYVLYKDYIIRIDGPEELKKFCPLCAIGESNKGKTFILNLLTNNVLKSGVEYKTLGISCKFTSFNEGNEDDDDLSEKRYLLFDTAGRSEPLLIDPKEKKKYNNEELKKTVEKNNHDLRISEDFMKTVLIKYSKIIIVVVNNLSLAEQLFLYELKNEGDYEELFIIHNIFHFKTKEQIEDYIENTIINSIYFDLSKGYFTIYEESQNNIDKPYYFTEEIEKNGAKKSLIAHLILGDYESQDKWIKDFNEATIDFLKTKMQTCVADCFFDIGEILTKELTSENIIDEKTIKISGAYDRKLYDLSEEDFIKGTLKAEGRTENKENDIIEGNNFNIMGYTPHYIYNKDEENSSFIIEVECAGIEDKEISITAKQRKAKTIFNIKGKKIYPEELKNLNPIQYSDKPFSINFSVNIEKEKDGKEFFRIVTGPEIDKKKPKYENGIYKKIFPMLKLTKNIERKQYETTKA